MAVQLTAEHARESLSAHVAARGAEIFAKYGPRVGWHELAAILADRACVRYPCTLAFAAEPLRPGEFAHPTPLGSRPEDGFTLHVHPVFSAQREMVPYLVLYQLVAVNYGAFASAEDAETFASAEDAALCRLADQVPGGQS